jgi:2-oxoglutarate ferredoxin oxidoreductase subunit alpha
MEAARIAVEYRTPVILLSDAYLANGSEPWLIPDVEALPSFSPDFAEGPNSIGDEGEERFLPYLRDPATLARPWAPPGLAGLEHRIGGLEKADGAGTVSYEGANHERMTHLRKERIERIADSYEPTVVNDPSGAARICVVGWGSTFGAIDAGVNRVRAAGHDAAHLHLTHLNPLPKDLGDILRRYETVLVPELNLGQLVTVLRAGYLVDARPLSKVRGVPFRAAEIESAILEHLGAAK